VLVEGLVRDNTNTIRVSLVLVEDSAGLDGKVAIRKCETQVESCDDRESSHQDGEEGDAGDARHLSTP